MEQRPVQSGTDRESQILQKRTAPIVASARVRRSGSRRQAMIALFTVAVIGAVIAVAWFWLAPKEESFTLGSYTASPVALQTLRSTVEIAGIVVARRRASVTSPEQGFVERLAVAEGDWVSAGQTVAWIDAPTLRDSLVANQRSLERSLREFDRFLLQHEFSLRSAARQRSMLELEIADAIAHRREVEELAAVDLATAADREAARRRVENAEASLDDHDATRGETLALHELSRRNYEDDIAATRQTIADLELRLAATRVTAPISGRVISIASGALTPGVVLQQYGQLMEIADTRNPLVQSQIEQQYVGLIGTGHPVAVEITGSRIAGQVERIGLTAATAAAGGTPVVDIDVALAVGDGEFLPGSTTVVELVVGEIPDAMVLPRGPFLTSGNRQFVYRVDGTTATRIAVTYGAVTNDYVQILTGVRPGDRIITSSYAGFLDRESITLGGS